MWERVIDGPVLNFIKNVSFGHDKVGINSHQTERTLAHKPTV